MWVVPYKEVDSTWDKCYVFTRHVDKKIHITFVEIESFKYKEYTKVLIQWGVVGDS